jgi:hypothetical protein
MPEIKLIKTGMKLSLILLCVLLFLLLSSSAALAAMMGDVNDDGRVNVQDVILVQKHILSPSLTTAQQAVADVNGDGVINVRDATLIMQYSLGLITEFPVGPSTPGVKSVRAIASDTIAVEFFDTPTVAEKAALTITIRNVSNLVVPTTVSWNENVAMVSRLLGQSYSAGTFSVEVLGITPPYNGYVVVTAASAVNVIIEATSLPINTAKAPLRVKLLDQYGNELPMLEVTFTKTAYNLTTHTPVTVGFDPRAQFFIDTRPRVPHEVTFNVGDEIRVTFVHRATGLEETVVIPVTPEVQLGSITFGEIILPALRTVLTKDLTNVRIPFTAKDQNGNPLILVDGANVNLYSSDQSIVSNSNLRFAWFAGEQNILIERFLNKGPVIITVMGTPGGVVGNKFLNVEEGLPYELRVLTEPAEYLLPAIPGRLSGISTLIRLRVIDQFGLPVTPTVADQSFEIVTIKSSGANSVLELPPHNNRYTLAQAGTTGIRITSGTVPGTNDTITFRLQRKDGTFVDSISRTVYIIQDFQRLSIQTDRLAYVAGENVSLTIKAMIGNQIHYDYNNTGRAEIQFRSPDGITLKERIFRDITFRDGLATTAVPAKVAGDDLRVFVIFSTYPEFEADNRVDILPGSPSRFRIEATTGQINMSVFLTDSQDNVITSVSEPRILKLTFPESAIKPPGIDAENKLLVTFVNGVATFPFGGPLVTGTYTVEDEIWDIKGSKTLTN